MAPKFSRGAAQTLHLPSASATLSASSDLRTGSTTPTLDDPPARSASPSSSAHSQEFSAYCLFCNSGVHISGGMNNGELRERTQKIRYMCSKLDLNVAQIPKVCHQRVFPFCASCDSIIQRFWEVKQMKVKRDQSKRVAGLVKTLEKTVMDAEILYGGGPGGVSAPPNLKRFATLRMMIVEGYKRKLAIKGHRRRNSLVMGKGVKISVNVPGTTAALRNYDTGNKDNLRVESTPAAKYETFFGDSQSLMELKLPNIKIDEVQEASLPQTSTQKLKIDLTDNDHQPNVTKSSAKFPGGVRLREVRSRYVKGVRFNVFGKAKGKSDYLSCNACHFVINCTKFLAEGKLPYVTMKHHLLRKHVDNPGRRSSTPQGPAPLKSKRARQTPSPPAAAAVLGNIRSRRSRAEPATPQTQSICPMNKKRKALTPQAYTSSKSKRLRKTGDNAVEQQKGTEPVPKLCAFLDTKCLHYMKKRKCPYLSKMLESMTCQACPKTYKKVFYLAKHLTTHMSRDGWTRENVMSSIAVSFPTQRLTGS